MTSTTVSVRSEQQEGARLLVEMARGGLHEEQRQCRRFPFFQPVTIDLPNLPGGLPAFSRDISAWGIGLLLNSPLLLGEVKLRIHFGDQENIAVSGYVRWCQPCGHGWYLAGVSFNDSGDELGYMIGGFTG